MEWTYKQEWFLIKNYLYMSNAQIGTLLGIGAGHVRDRLTRLRLERPYKWTNRKHKMLRRYVRTSTWEELSVLLDVPVEAIKHKVDEIKGQY